MQLKVDAEFKALIPPLKDEEWEGLERSILEDGIRDPLVLWGDILVDGHNRYEIAQLHDVPFSTVQKEFDSRDDAKLWIYRNQLSRRNLNDFQRIEITHKCEDAVRAKAAERQSPGVNQYTDRSVEILPPTSKARDELGSMAGVSGKTYEHAVTVLESAPEQVTEATRSGDLSINAAYQVTRMEQDEQDEIAQRIESGESPREVVREVKNRPHVANNSDWFSDRQRNDTSHQDGNDEYNDFVDKFEVKKTTDDCYTPDLVYDAVLDWVRNEYGISEDTQIVRPFYPNGDYEHEDYPEGCVVVDNPPFSILSEILRFYVDSSVKFFLFAPALTLFSPRAECCRIPTGVTITYENGANVSTSFMTNLDTKNAIRTAPDLYVAVDAANKQNREDAAKSVNLKYKYPSHVITSAMVSGWCELGVEFAVPKGNEYQVGCLDAQKEYDKRIFGSGFLLSDECARDAERAKADAERAKALEAAKALGDGVEVEPDGSVVWRLSERELAIVEGLGK